MSKPPIHPAVRYCVIPLLSFSGLILAFFISWLILAQANFAYGGLHDVLDIEPLSQHYGPLNRYREGFELTDKAEKVRLFAAINTAVHQQGQGLSDIYYHDPNGQVINTLLHQAEITHLEDVGRLIDTVKLLAIIASSVWLGLIVGCYFKHIPPPGLKQQSLGIASLLLCGGLLVVLLGPVEVFYGLHEWFFPSGHQWFFYYEESLMSTLMKAPDLFGAIAILLSILALMVFVLLNGLVSTIIHRLTR